MNLADCGQLYTERTLMRPFSSDDLSACTGESGNMLLHFLSGPDVLAILSRKTGLIVGSIGLHPDPMRAHPQARSVSYALIEPYWGRGIMPECLRAVLSYAFSQMELEVISASLLPDNARSRRVLEKCGFEFEGCLRRCVRSAGGRIYDVQSYSILRREFERLPSQSIAHEAPQ